MPQLIHQLRLELVIFQEILKYLVLIQQVTLHYQSLMLIVKLVILLSILELEDHGNTGMYLHLVH